MDELQDQWMSKRYGILKFGELYENLKELYNFQSFDYDTMPEISRKKAHKLLMMWINDQFDIINDKKI